MMTYPGFNSAKEASKTHDPDFVALKQRDAVILADARQDNMMTALLALGMEVWTLRRRMLVTEAVLQRNGIPVDEVESYQPGEDEHREWTRERDMFLKTVFGNLGRGADGHRLIDLVPASYQDPASRAVKTNPSVNGSSK